jgi:hypothetical protein
VSVNANAVKTSFFILVVPSCCHFGCVVEDDEPAKWPDLSYSASSSLWPLCGTCHSAPKICSSLPGGGKNERHVTALEMTIAASERRRAVVVERAALFGPRENDRHQRRVDGDQPIFETHE